jgi:hypothetical protein
MVERLGIEESKLAELGNLLYKNYGTTMAGLRVWDLNFLSPHYIPLKSERTVLMECFWVVPVLQAIGYDFDYDEYHR